MLVLACRLASRANPAVLPLTPDSTESAAIFTACRSTKQYPEAESQPNVLILRIDSPIWFANVEVSGELRWSEYAGCHQPTVGGS